MDGRHSFNTSDRISKNGYSKFQKVNDVFRCAITADLVSLCSSISHTIGVSKKIIIETRVIINTSIYLAQPQNS